MKPIILIDVDGVLLQWQSGLPFFCSENNLCTSNALKMITTEEFMNPSQIFGVNDEIAGLLMRKYNESKYIRYLRAYDDAIQFMNMYKDKFDFIAVTALSSNENAVMNRLFNLNTLFPSAFIDIHSCNFGESKTQMLTKIKNSEYGGRVVAFIDDLPQNIDDCHGVFGNTIDYIQVIRSRTHPRHISNFSYMTCSNLMALDGWANVCSGRKVWNV